MNVTKTSLMALSNRNARLCSLHQDIIISQKSVSERQSQPFDEELFRDNFAELGTADLISVTADSCDLYTFVAGRIEEYERTVSDRWRKVDFSSYAPEWQCIFPG